MYYSSIGILAIFVHLIINREFLRIKPEKPYNDEEKRYAGFLWCVMVYFLVDAIWGCMYETHVNFLIYISTMLFFFVMAGTVWTWSKFLASYLKKDNIFSRIVDWSGLILFILQVVVLIINIFKPIMFTVSKGVYYPAKIRYIVLCTQAVFYALISVYAIVVAVRTKDNSKSHHRAVGASALIMTLFITLQALFPLMPFYAIGCLLTSCMLHSFIYNDKIVEISHEVGVVQTAAYRDPLTGVKNKLAYLEAVKNIEKRMAEKKLAKYSVAVFDVNNLKFVNDNYGHDAGDEYIKSASNMICQRFKHSPVYRIGGDEFVAILEEDDFRYRKLLVETFDREVEENLMDGKVVISCGYDDFDIDKDLCYDDVFKRADKKMYDRKMELKEIVIH